MARIRSIKPDFWTSEQVMECSPIARLMFIGMWNFADDHGRMPAAPKTIKAQIFPADDVDATNVRRMIDELSANGLIRLYEIDGKEFLLITGWHHQKIDKRQPAKYPEPTPIDSTNVRRTVSTDLRGSEGIGEERNTCAIAKATRTRATYNEKFEEAWQAYPRRDGGNPKPPAAKRFLAAVKAGADPQAIIDGAKRFAVAEVRNVGTPYIPQMVKWLGDQRWLDYGPNMPTQPVFDVRKHIQ